MGTQSSAVFNFFVYFNRVLGQDTTHDIFHERKILSPRGLPSMKNTAHYCVLCVVLVPDEKQQKSKTRHLQSLDGL